MRRTLMVGGVLMASMLTLMLVELSEAHASVATKMNSSASDLDQLVAQFNVQ